MERERLRIGEVARDAGVNVQTLHYYERRGLLEEVARTPSGYREYTPETVRLIRFIKRAQALGFTLEEIKDLLALREHGPRDKKRVLALAQTKLQGVEEKIRRLQAIRKALAPLVESCLCGGDVRHCPIIEALEDDVPGPGGDGRGRRTLAVL